MTSLKTIKLRLPAHFHEIDVARIGEGFECPPFNSLAFNAYRDDNHNATPWSVEWMFDGTQADAALEPLRRHVIAAAAIYNLNLPDTLDFDVIAVPNRDWLMHSYQQFQSFEVGSFYIHGSHDDTPTPNGKMDLQIDAATAFGSGEHGTTAGCLNAMQDLKAQGVCPWNVLDMGTGSGILAIAAWKLWKTPVLAVDNDPESVVVTKRHCELNKVPQGASDITAQISEGFSSDIVQKKAPYELVIANILAGPLRDMAADLAASVDDNGYVILSGILNEQADSVVECYQAENFNLRDQSQIKDWTTLVFQNAA